MYVSTNLIFDRLTLAFDFDTVVQGWLTMVCLMAMLDQKLQTLLLTIYTKTYWKTYPKVSQ